MISYMYNFTDTSSDDYNNLLQTVKFHGPFFYQER